MLIFALQESRQLGEEIARHCGVELSPLEERPFDGGEYKLRPLVSVRGQTVFIAQTLAGSTGMSPSESLLRLLLLCMGLRDAGAAEVVAMVPYLAFARKDRRTQPRDPVTSRYVAQLLEAAGFAHVVALDVHNPAAFDNAFRIPVTHLSAQPLLCAQLSAAGNPAGCVVVSPDVGGIKRAQLFREQLERQAAAPVDLAFIEKRRAGGRLSGGTVVGDVAARRVIVLDDMCASGGTLLRAADTLLRAGAGEVQAAVTHAPLAAGISALLDSPALAKVTVTDSAGPGVYPLRGPRLCVVPVAQLFAAALKRLVARQPLTPLLERWPPPE